MSVRGRVIFWVLFAVVLGWTVFLRCWGTGGRAFWSDEAWVAHAIRTMSAAELLRQGELPVPSLFALGTKLTGAILSPAEWGYRLLPMICGVALVPLCYLTARTLRAPRITALVAMAAGVWYYAGATEYLLYQPTTAGTLPMPGFPLEVMVKRITATGAPTWWIVTTSDRKVQAYLQRLIQTHGFQLQLKAEAGGDQAYGRAQLLLASKPGAER